MLTYLLRARAESIVSRLSQFRPGALSGELKAVSQYDVTIYRNG